MAYDLSTAMIEAAKEITVAVLREDKQILEHGQDNPQVALNQTIERVSKLYNAVFSEVWASYQKRGTAREAASVN